MWLKRIVFLGLGALTVSAAAVYGYVFIAGAPQLDPPVIEANTGLTFQVETFNSQVMGTTRRYGVILPPGYAQHPDQRYSVIFLLHGGHDDERSFYEKYAVTDVLHDLYQQGKLPPSLVIMPDGNDNRGSSPLWDPQYFDGPNGKVGTLIGAELVQWVKTHYRTLTAPQFWAIGGISSGGWALSILGCST